MKFGSLFLSKIFLFACLFLSSNLLAMEEEDDEKIKQIVNLKEEMEEDIKRSNLEEETLIKELEKKANPIQVSYLIIYIDDSDEINQPDKALSINLKQAILEQAAPCLIFGKHLLDNVIKSLNLDKLPPEEWIVSDLIYTNKKQRGDLEVILTIPKIYAKEHIKEDISKFTKEKILEDLGFSSKNFKEKTKEIPNLDYKIFSELIPDVLNDLLDTSPKCVYVMGHGVSIGSESTYGNIFGKGLIANLFIPDALKLFSILENKNTRLLYVSTCFLGGKNLLEVQNSLNKNLNIGLSAGKPSNMIFISGATTQAMTGQTPSSFNNFFRAFWIYLNKEEKLKKLAKETRDLSAKEKSEKSKDIKDLTKEIGSLKATRQYFAENITNWLTNWLTNYNVSAIPQIRFPMRDAKFYSLAPAVIDEITLGRARGIPFKDMVSKPTNLEFSDQQILVINVPEIDVPIIINGRIPLFISGIGLRNFSFENIAIKGTECNFSDFMAKAIIGEFRLFDGKTLFSGSNYKETFVIKKLVLTEETQTNIGAKVQILHERSITRFGDKVPLILYDVSITREGDFCNAKFKIVQNSKDFYRYEFKKIGKEEKISWFKVSEETYHDDLSKLLKAGNIEKFKELLKNVNKNYPNIINSFSEEGQTFLIEEIKNNNLENVKILINAGANLTLKDQSDSTPLSSAALEENLDILKYLVNAGANVNEKDKYGNTILHRLAEGHGEGIWEILAGKKATLGLIKYVVEEAHADINAENINKNTPLHIAVFGKNLDNVKYLVKAGAKVDLINKHGDTPLHLAAKKGLLPIVIFLAEDANADINAKNKNGKTPKDLAREKGKNEVVKYLESE